jgi:hypothetical protein
MTGIVVLGLSNWAHHSWLPKGRRARTERAQARANADLLARFPLLTSVSARPPMPPFATLPRPACAKVLRVAAALAHAGALRRIVGAAGQQRFAIRIAPNVLHAIQRDARGTQTDLDLGASLDLFDRLDMTAAGLRVAQHALHELELRVLMELRLPRVVAQRAARFGVGDTSVKTARDLLAAAHALLRAQRSGSC